MLRTAQARTGNICDGLLRSVEVESKMADARMRQMEAILEKGDSGGMNVEDGGAVWHGRNID